MAAAGLLDALDMVVVTEEVKYKGKKAYVSLWELTKKNKRKYPKDGKDWSPVLDGLLIEDKFKVPDLDPIDMTGIEKRQGVDKRSPLMGAVKKRKKK